MKAGGRGKGYRRTWETMSKGKPSLKAACPSREYSGSVGRLNPSTMRTNLISSAARPSRYSLNHMDPITSYASHGSPHTVTVNVLSDTRAGRSRVIFNGFIPGAVTSSSPDGVMRHPIKAIFGCVRCEINLFALSTSMNSRSCPNPRAVTRDDGTWIAPQLLIG